MSEGFKVYGNSITLLFCLLQHSNLSHISGLPMLSHFLIPLHCSLFSNHSLCLHFSLLFITAPFTSLASYIFLRILYISRLIHISRFVHYFRMLFITRLFNIHISPHPLHFSSLSHLWPLSHLALLLLFSLLFLHIKTLHEQTVIANCFRNLFLLICNASHVCIQVGFHSSWLSLFLFSRFAI